MKETSENQTFIPSRRGRTEVLVREGGALARKWAKTLEESFEIRAWEEPCQSLVLLQLRDAALGSRFHPGEVLVTEARVLLVQEDREVMGLGLVQGHHNQLARDLAVIDAASRAGVGDLAHWYPLLQEAWAGIKNQEDQETREILATAVNFDTMEVS